jgi:lysophospholipase L1-like esterase
LLSETRDLTSARRFFQKALAAPGHPRPRVINVDGNPSYPTVIEKFKHERVLGRRCRCRIVPYLNSIVEQDHRSIKRRVNASLGFRSFDGAQRTIQGYEAPKKITAWPFLTGVDVEASSRGAAIIAFGSSLTDGDGTEPDSNGRWPDVLAQRLQKSLGGKAEVGVLNEGIIGNRLLNDSPLQAAGGRFGAMLGQAGLTRFERDVLTQSGAKYVIVGLGINDIAMPGSLTPATERIKAESIIAGYRQLIARAHQRGIRIIGTTNPPFENSFLDLGPPASPITFYTPEKESARRKVNDWILNSGEFDGVVDFDAVLRDPSHPTQLLPRYDSGDHLHPNNAGCRAEGNAIPLSLFEGH